MRGLFIISSMDTGGAQKLFSNVLTHLPEDWDIDILLNTDEKIEFPYKGKIISLGIKEPKDRNGLLYQFGVFGKRLKKLRELKRSRNYDFAISAMDSANVVNILTGGLPGSVVITILNNMSASKDRFHNKYIVIPLMKLLYNKADRIVALSQDVKDDIVNHFGIRAEKTDVVYCSIDLKQLDEVRKGALTEKEQMDFSREHTIITAGRMDDQKGQWHLIRAFHRVAGECPDSNLVIFGTGVLEPYFKKLIADYGLQERVLLYGFSNELVKYISNSAVFAFPSVYEGFGTALQEALACDVPCVCTDYQSGGSEIMEPERTPVMEVTRAKYGIITPSCSIEKYDAAVPLDKSEECLAEALIMLLKDEALRREYAEKARERAVIYDIDSIAGQWIDIFNQLS